MIKLFTKATTLLAFLASQPVFVNEMLLASPEANTSSQEAIVKQGSKTEVSQKGSAQEKNIDSFVIATVNGVKITAADISNAIDQSTPDRGAILVKRDEKLLRTFVENYINELLILQDKEVHALASRPDVKAKLEYAHRSTLVKAWLLDLFSRSAKKGNLVAIAQESARSGEFNRFKVQQLQFSERSTAESVLKRIKENPVMIDKEVSSSEAPSAKNSGQIGWIKKDDLPSELASALSSLKDGEVHPSIIQTKFGFHILKLKTSQILTAEDILDDYTLRQTLAERLVAKEREEKLSAYRKKAKITVFDENLPQVAP